MTIRSVKCDISEKLKKKTFKIPNTFSIFFKENLK